MINKLTTPSEINTDIHRLCEKIGNVKEPVYINVKPRKDSIIDECYIDVENQVKEYGGSVQYGWMIWVWTNFYAEATFHTVWKKPNGEFLDVSLKQDGENKILFAPDNTRKFTNAQIPSVRIPLCIDPRVNQWIELKRKLEEQISFLNSQTKFESGIEPTEEMISLDNQSRLLLNELLQDFHFFG